MSRQYLRNYKLTIVGQDGTARVITELRINFEVQKFIFNRANTAIIRLYNTSQQTRALLQTKYTKIILEVGYGTNLKVLFTGDIRNVFQKRQNVDAILEVYAADGEVALLNTTFNKTYEPEITMDQIVEEIATSFGKAIGTIVGGPTAADKVLGFSISGSSKQALNELAQEYDFNWNIENDTLNIVGDSEAIFKNEIVNINSGTGMIGSPTLTETGVDVTTLLNPLLAPNRLFQITSNTAELSLGNLFVGRPKRTEAEGIYKITEVLFTGDSREGNWTSTAKGITYNG
jgi:hypothetical protein